MVYFRTYNELYGTVYEHRAATPTDDDDRHVGPVRAAWCGELMQQRRDEERLNAGMPYVGDITRLQVWPGRLSGLVLLDEDAEPAYPGRAHGYPRTLDVFWPRLLDEQWLLLAGATRPHAHQLTTDSSEDAMLRILDLAVGLDVNLLPTFRELKTSDCPCRSRKSVCEHIAALIECYARTLEREPLTLLLLAGCAPTDFFALVDDPEHPSAQPYYQPDSLPQPTVDARNFYYWRQWHTAPALPPLPAPPAQSAAASSRPDLGNPAHQLLARAASARAADLLSQALRRRQNPLVDPVRRLTPERDAARLAAHQSSAEDASPTA